MIQFSEEQAMLLDTARAFCQQQAPIAQIRNRIEGDQALDQPLWQAMVELGWLGITIPEAQGGLGMDLADTVPIIEAMGRQLVASPMLATTLAIQVLKTNGSDQQQEEWFPKLAAGDIASVAVTEAGGAWDLSLTDCELQDYEGGLIFKGTKTFVQDAAVSNLLIVLARYQGALRWCLVDMGDVPASNIRREAVIDETKKSYSIDLSDVCISRANVLPGTDTLTFELATLLLLSAEMSGGIEGTLAVIVDYLKTRKQFDQYIGSYQALKHPTVDILMGAEMVRSHLYHAATLWRQSAGSAELESAVRMAKCCASEQFAEAGDRGVQFHGGFGFTYECDAQLFLRRALWGQYQFGDERYQRQQLAALLW